MVKKIIIRRKHNRNTDTSTSTCSDTPKWVFELGQRLLLKEGKLFTGDNTYIGLYSHDSNCPNCQNSNQCWYYIQQK